MAEKEAFSALVQIMYDYKLRDLFQDRSYNLGLRLFQLNCMIEVKNSNKLIQITMSILI